MESLVVPVAWCDRIRSTPLPLVEPQEERLGRRSDSGSLRQPPAWASLLELMGRLELPPALASWSVLVGRLEQPLALR